MILWWINILTGVVLLVEGILTKGYILSVVGIIMLLIAWSRYSKVKGKKDEKPDDFYKM
jgi:uncharacterized membrane protein